MSVRSAKTMTPVGLLLRELRHEKNLSMDALAKKIGCHKSLISRFEDGSGALGRDVAKKISTFFDGRITRDQIVFPEEYVVAGGKKPVRSAAITGSR